MRAHLLERAKRKRLYVERYSLVGGQSVTAEGLCKASFAFLGRYGSGGIINVERGKTVQSIARAPGDEAPMV